MPVYEKYNQNCRNFFGGGHFGGWKRTGAAGCVLWFAADTGGKG